MINTLKIFNELKEIMDPVAAEKIADTVGSIYEELKSSVTKTEFNELKGIVAELAEAQKRTEVRVEELAEAQKRTEKRVEELAEAQKRTEKRVEELAEAQKRTEKRVEELAEAQKRTEKRVEELAEAQKRTEKRVEELAEAQKRTEKRLEQVATDLSRLEKQVDRLVGEMKDFKVQLGGLAHTVGYRLEDEAMRSLPALIKKDLSIETQSPLIRGYLEVGPQKYVELNIWGHGLREGKPVEIIGEAKSQLKKRDVDMFLKTINTIEPFIHRPIVPIVVTYQTSPDVQKYVDAKGIKLYFSYQL